MTTLEEYLKFNPYDSEEEHNLAEFARKIQDDRDKWRGIAERLAELLACLEYFGTDVYDWPTVHSVKTALAAYEEAKK